MGARTLDSDMPSMGFWASSICRQSRHGECGNPAFCSHFLRFLREQSVLPLLPLAVGFRLMQSGAFDSKRLLHSDLVRIMPGN